MPEHDETSAAAITTRVTETADRSGHSGHNSAEAESGRIQPVGDEKDEFGLPLRKPRRRLSVSKNGEVQDGENGIRESSGSPKPLDGPKTTQSAAPDSEQRTNGGTSAKSELQNGHTSHEPVPRKDSITAAADRPRSESLLTSSSEQRAKLPTQAQEGAGAAVSEWSHQQLAPTGRVDEIAETENETWQEMPAYAPYDIYNDDGKLVAKEADVSDDEQVQYGQLGGAGKGYTRVQVDEDAKSATSMDDNTAYLFKERGTDLLDDEEESRDPLAQMQTTKTLLTEGQRIAYVGLTRLAIADMSKVLDGVERTRASKKAVDTAKESLVMWGQKMMVRLYSHMDIDAAEQVMIEQLQEHGVQPADLSPALMRTSRVKNPVADEATVDSMRPTSALSRRDASDPHSESTSPNPRGDCATTAASSSSSPLSPTPGVPEVQLPSDIEKDQTLNIDLRWTVLCDLFLVLISDSVYDARSRVLLERVGSFLDVSWLEICQFEKRVTDALEMQESSSKENWNEDDHMEKREKMARKRRLAMMGLATVGGGLVIGLSAGLLAPLIGAGLAVGFSTIGVAGTSGFLAGTGGAAIITTTGIVTGSTIGVRASGRRTGAVRTFEYRPLHNNKKVNLIVTVSGWMSGKIDDVRLPYSTVDPVMGDLYTVFWEPEMLQSMGQTINILATEALTQGLQQVLGSTILISLMASLQLPIVLTKLSYLIDNPWTVSLARAELAGLILADSLIDRNLGTRPITLVGFSLGARVIFSALREMAKKGAYGLIQNVYLFGSPLVASKDEYLKVQSIVAGRFVNGYCTNDWILGYLFRATSGGIRRVAGLAPVLVDGIENHDVTELVPGHMAYRTAMPRLLSKVGWEVESEEFSEIEDPDPDNHDKRQRELINEIEEARKDIEDGKKGKWRFGLFKRNKLAEKNEWETYDERLRDDMDSKAAADIVDKEGSVMFDIDAIRAEAAEIAAQGMEVKQLETTMPPMKLDFKPRDSLKTAMNVRATKSDDRLAPDDPTRGNPGTGLGPSSTTSLPVFGRTSTDYRYHDGNVSGCNGAENELEPGISAPSYQDSRSPAMQQLPSRHSSLSPAPPPYDPSTPPQFASAGNNSDQAPDYNAWADDEEFCPTEEEVSMTFE